MRRFSRENISNVADKVIGPVLILTGIGIAAATAFSGKPTDMDMTTYALNSILTYGGSLAFMSIGRDSMRDHPLRTRVKYRPTAKDELEIQKLLAEIEELENTDTQDNWEPFPQPIPGVYSAPLDYFNKT